MVKGLREQLVFLGHLYPCVEQSEIEYDYVLLGHSFFVTLDDRVSAIRESALVFLSSLPSGS